MPSKLWDEITYAFLDFNGATQVIKKVIRNHDSLPKKSDWKQLYFIVNIVSADDLAPVGAKPSLVQIMACCLSTVKPLSEPILAYS